MKVIVCNTPRGQFEIPLRPVAEDRADYFACHVDGFEKGGKEWQDEVDLAMNDRFEAIDWLLNDTDWEDWESMAVKLNNKVKVTDDDFWTSSDDFQIKENGLE